MNTNWFKRLTTSALAFSLGTGMLFVSGCNDCDNCEEKHVESACCEDNAIETSYDGSYTPARSEAASTDVDAGQNVSVAQPSEPSPAAAPSTDVNVSTPAPAPDVSVKTPAAPAPDVSVQTPAPAAPVPDVSVQTPPPAAPAAPAPAPEVSAPAAPVAPAAPATAQDLAPKADATAPAADATAPKADADGDRWFHGDKAPLSQDLQALSFFEGRWNIDQHFTGDDNMGLGTNATGHMFFRSGLDGHALIGHMFLKGDKGNFSGMVVITPAKGAKSSASMDQKPSDEAAIPTSADDKSAAPLNVSNSNFNVFWSDSMGHSGMSKDASWDGNKFTENFQYTENGKNVSKRCTYTKESNDKVSFVGEMDNGQGFKTVCNGTMTRNTESIRENVKERMQGK